MNKIFFIMIIITSLVISGCTAVSVTPNEIITKDYIQLENERGQVFDAFEYFETVPNNENRSIVIQTNGKQIKLLQYTITTTDSPDDFLIYEGVSTSALGSPLDVYSKNREKVANNTAQLFHSPTVTDYGTVIQRDLITSAKKTSGQSKNIQTPFILKKNTTYIIMGDNRGGTQEMLFNIEWLEYEIE